MGMRKLARQIAFLLIYMADMGDEKHPTLLERLLSEDGLDEFMQAAELPAVFSELPGEGFLEPITDADKNYIRDCVEGTDANRTRIDAIIDEQTLRWGTRRMLSADRNILRLSIYEMMTYKDAVDLPVFINEAVELAKIYGDDDSYKFVNAVLDGVAKRGELDVQ